MGALRQNGVHIMKASRKRALRAPKGNYRAKTYDLFGRLVKADAESKLAAVVAMNKAVRNTGKMTDWDNVSVVTNNK